MRAMGWLAAIDSVDMWLAWKSQMAVTHVYRHFAPAGVERLNVLSVHKHSHVCHKLGIKDARWTY